MTNRILSPKYLFPLLIIGASLAISLTIIAQAQTDSTSSPQAAITFPISELGNCGSKSECRDYCNESGNMEACIKFAEEHGLMNKDEASRAEKFRERIQSGNTPGGCNSVASCKSFCSEPANLETCVKFAEEHGIKYEKKERAERFAELARSGETPGNCTSKEECESFCRDEANRETCIAFGKRLGFINERRAEAFRNNENTGPGGCDSKESCRVYCNDSANEESCLKFAEERRLIRSEDAEEVKENLMRLREKFEGVSSTIATCLKSNLGTNIIEDIRAGKLTPGTEINERVRSCFEGRTEEKDDVRPANLKELRNFIKEATSTEWKLRMERSDDERPGLNKETFEKFRQGTGVQSDGFEVPQKFQEQFRQQLKERIQAE